MYWLTAPSEATQSRSQKTSKTFAVITHRCIKRKKALTLDRENRTRPERQTVIIATKLARYDIDIAVLSETKQFQPDVNQCTFIWQREDDSVRRMHGAVSNSLSSNWRRFPWVYLDDWWRQRSTYRLLANNLIVPCTRTRNSDPNKFTRQYACIGPLLILHESHESLQLRPTTECNFDNRTPINRHFPPGREDFKLAPPAHLNRLKYEMLFKFTFNWQHFVQKFYYKKVLLCNVMHAKHAHEVSKTPMLAPEKGTVWSINNE